MSGTGNQRSDVLDLLAEQVDGLAESMVASWHASDSDRFAEHFHPDAVFVDVLGRLLRGRDKIARIHRLNFDTIHAGSRLSMTRLDAESLADRVAIAHIGSTIWVPAGPLAGGSKATQTWILDNTRGSWLIRAFHNTFVREMAGVPSL
jgi:uncharacterized protein (TIGR02246 family)